MSSFRSRSGGRWIGNDVQPVEQIFAERALGHHLLQIAVGGGNDAHVDLGRVRVADALELALLQHAQQLHLHARAHRPDFVEEQRALVRLLEPSLPRADGAGKRAAHVAEQLGLEQRLGNRAAVERDEPLRAPRAVVMNRARDDFLAGAGFAGDQDRARRRRHGFEQLKQRAHGGAAADEPLELVALLQLRAQIRVLGLEPALLERGVQRVQQLVELKRLGDEVGRAALDRFDRVLHRSVSGDDDADDVGIAQQRGFEHARAVEARQTQVGDDDVEGKFGELLDGLLARVGLLDFESVLGQALGERLAQRRFVFDEQEMFLGFSHLRERQYFDIESRKWKVESKKRGLDSPIK